VKTEAKHRGRDQSRFFGRVAALRVVEAVGGTKAAYLAAPNEGLQMTASISRFALGSGSS
jgi:hypothetical protein